MGIKEMTGDASAWTHVQIYCPSVADLGDLCSTSSTANNLTGIAQAHTLEAAPVYGSARMSLSGFANHCATANDWGVVETEGEVGCRGKWLTACSTNMVAFDIRTSADFQMSDVIQRTVKIAKDRLNLAGLRENQRKTVNQSPRPRCGDVPS